MKVARAHLEGALCFLKSNKSSGSKLSRAKSGVRRLGKSVLFFRLDFERVRQKGVILRGDEMFWTKRISDLMRSKTIWKRKCRDGNWIFFYFCWWSSFRLDSVKRSREIRNRSIRKSEKIRSISVNNCSDFLLNILTVECWSGEKFKNFLPFPLIFTICSNNFVLILLKCSLSLWLGLNFVGGSEDWDIDNEIVYVLSLFSR